MRRSSNRGFTLAEVLIAFGVFTLFLVGVYSLFFGGQRVAGKAAWLNFTVTNLRKAEEVITKAIKTTSYPSTLTPSKFFDVGGGTGVPATNSAYFYIHVPPGFGKKTPAQIFAANGICMYLVKSSPEKKGFEAPENQFGTMAWSIFKLETCPDRSDQGNLVLEERIQNYSTSFPTYAESLTSSPAGATFLKRLELVRNVEWIDITTTTATHTPKKITVTISTAYPKDPKLSRQGISAAVPNVGIIAAP